ncbi:MAG TPA: hypothetical protein VHH88_14325 [Verrucomicrobiae bacterium]|nr:hypothetical protein [Verrucomicrobiae bacterium]
MTFSLPASARSKVFKRHLADYDDELRLANKHVDCEAMVKRLQDLGVTSYYWLIWHEKTDWDDLKIFLPQAARARISVYVYLVPPTEGHSSGYPSSEPFGEDYPKWAEEIARLSRQYPNLRGWIIDDFYANHRLFTPEYVRQTRRRARKINPDLVFLPLMYFPEITSQFAEAYHDVIDGCVIAYPPDRNAIRNARAVLDGKLTMVPGQFGCPWQTPTAAGDFASASTVCRARGGQSPRVTFKEEDDFTGPTAGYHYKQLLVDDEVVWEQDVAGGEKAWKEEHIDLAPWVTGKPGFRLTFRLYDRKGVGNFGIHWRVKDLRAEGFKLSASLQSPWKWQVASKGPIETGFGKRLIPPPQKIHIPFVVMTAAQPQEFRLRHGDPATPQRMGEWLQMCLKSWRAGECDGVATYVLDKRPESKFYPVAKELFRKY